MMNNILEVKNLSKKYNDFELKNVSFELPKGMILGFIGENGAGKTTTIKMILRLIDSDSGEIKVNGYDIYDDPEKAKNLLRFAYIS